MKKLKRLITAVICLVMMMSQLSYAQTPTWEDLIGTRKQSVLKPGALTASDKVVENARGTIFSTAILNITNEEDGTLYISADILVHKKIDKAYQTIFLDEWDAERNDWVQIGYWEYERTKEEEESGELTSYHVGFTVSGCIVNHYYRARATHFVQLGDDIEGKATRTDGVLLTKK